MVHKGIIERREEKLKPRGKPFPKNNVRGKSRSKVLAYSGHEGSNNGGGIITDNKSAIVEPLIEESTVFNLLPSSVVNTTDQILKENMENSNEKESNSVVEDSKSLELIESLDFSNGPNKLSIRFSKKHNRMFRIQIFLNDDNEIRPVTYAGATTGMAFWKLLKGVLKKL